MKPEEKQRRWERIMASDEWRQIDDAPDYFVSSSGRVASAITKRELKPSISAHGYKAVSLKTASARRISRSVHRLVAEAFLSTRPVGMVCNHIDGNKENNHVRNLEWVTPQENSQHSVRLGLGSGLNRDNLDRLLQLHREGWSVVELALIFEISEAMVRLALKRSKPNIPQALGDISTTEAP